MYFVHRWKHKTLMKKWALLFLAVLNLKVFAQVQLDSWLRIDCGANRSTATSGIVWQTDEDFIKTGSNYQIPDNSVTPVAFLNTLRVFTEQNKNCYTLPVNTMTRYFIRAVFFYANYDGLSRPPAFDLQIDGNKLVTVVSSLTKITYYETLYWSKNPNISVCLARTQDAQFPFITSLEAWPIPNTMYRGMSRDLAWINTYRYDYGPNNNGIVGYPGDDYNRIWAPISIPGTVNTTADSGTYIIPSSEDPPNSAILDAIEAQNETTSLFLSFGPIKTITSIYVEAYFTEMKYLNTRSFHMYVDGTSVGDPITPQYSQCSTLPFFLQATASNFTIELRPTATTALPPIISAIEVYTASDPLVTKGTDQNDLNGLETFTSTFNQLTGWSGEPCLPADTVWQWLSCTGSDPPRVTSINLSGYGLNGTLPNFSQMQALEDIDLSNNDLSGTIPGFLGQLPNLKKLNLSHNDFSGAIPSSIRNNRELTYDINGNPNVDTSGKDKSSKATIIGLAVGIPLVIVVLILAIVFWLIRKRANQGQNQGTEPEIAPGNVNGHESFTISGEQQHTQPPDPTAPLKPEEDDEDCVPVDAIDMKLDNQSMIPDMDLDELEELIDQHPNEGRHDEDYMEVPEYDSNVINDQSMVPDLDLEELDEIIKHEKERADELARHKSDG